MSATAPEQAAASRETTVSNVIDTIGKDILHGVEFPFEYTAKAIKVLDSAIKDQPAIKAAVIDLIKQAETVIGDSAKDVAEKGLVLTDDAKTLADAEAFFQYFRDQFCPLVANVYAEVASDLQ
jgi:fibrillarin-like rRNA methylase